MIADALQLLCAMGVGGATVYAVLTARGASEAAASSEASAEEAAEGIALATARQAALDRRLYACERAIDAIASLQNMGVKRKVESSATVGEQPHAG